MNQSYVADRFIIGPISLQYFLRVALIGAGVGFFCTLIAWGLSGVIFEPLLCQRQACSVSSWISWTTVFAITTITSLYVSVIQRVYRPLLVVLLAIILLAGLLPSISQSVIIIDLLVAAFTGALVFVLFAMTSRVRPFYGAVGVGIAVVLLGYLAAYL